MASRGPLTGLLLVGLAVSFTGCAARVTAHANRTAAGIHDRTGLSLPEHRITADLPSVPPGMRLDSPLSSDDAAAIALWNNRRLLADLASLGIARADLLDAGLIRNPRFDILFPVAGKPLEILVNLPVEVLLQRPRRVAASQAAYNQLSESLIQNGLNTIRDGRLAHADLVQAVGRVDVAERSVELRERIAQLTGARLRAGDISELDAVQAGTEAGVAQEQLARFRHDVVLAEERLRLALGLSMARTPIQVSAAPTRVSEPPALETLIEKALAARPDLRAIELSIATATRRARWERSRALWLMAQLSSKDIGDNGMFTGPGLSAEIPIFNRNQGLAARADAEVEAASRQYLATRQTVAFEVAEARRLVLQAQEAIGRTDRQIYQPLQRGVALAKEQYGKGDVAYLFVLEQTRAMIDAELRVVDFEAALRRAQAQLERSVGSR